MGRRRTGSTGLPRIDSKTACISADVAAEAPACRPTPIATHMHSAIHEGGSNETSRSKQPHRATVAGRDGVRPAAARRRGKCSGCRQEICLRCRDADSAVLSIHRQALDMVVCLVGSGERIPALPVRAFRRRRPGRAAGVEHSRLWAGRAVPADEDATDPWAVETKLFVPSAASIDVPLAFLSGLAAFLCLVVLTAPLRVVLAGFRGLLPEAVVAPVPNTGGAPPPTLLWRSRPPETAPPH